MLVKIGDRVINLEAISYIDLKQSIVVIHLIGERGCLNFWYEEAEILRWYFSHPTSKVKDLKGLKEQPTEQTATAPTEPTSKVKDLKGLKGVKIGDRVINLEAISYIDLDYTEYESKQSIVVIHLIGERGCLNFWDEEAEILRWYFSHPTSKVKDLKGLKG